MSLPAPSRAPGPDLEAVVRRLAELRAASAACVAGADAGPSAVDAIVSGGRLEAGRVHEWIGVAEPASAEPGDHVRRSAWSPALSLLLEMALRELRGAEGGHDRLVWIGESVWPYPAAIAAAADGAGVLKRCLFVRASRPEARLWATDLALRSRVGAAVVVDGSGFDLASTRRLQLAAEAARGGRSARGGVCLMARPAWERRELSASATRWLVSSAPSPSMNRRWTVELLRCKGMQPTAGAPRAWVVERDRATRSVRVVADVLDRPGEAQAHGELPVRQTG